MAVLEDSDYQSDSPGLSQGAAGGRRDGRKGPYAARFRSLFDHDEEDVDYNQLIDRADILNYDR